MRRKLCTLGPHNSPNYACDPKGLPCSCIKKVGRYTSIKEPKRLPKKLKKGNRVFELNNYGAYVDSSLYGIAQEKNAMSYGELIKLGYK